MKKLNYALLVTMTVIIFSSCSSSDKDADVVFSSITTNKKDVFIEEPIVVSLEGTGFTETNLTTTNSKVTIKRVTNTAFEVSSTEATACKLYAELKNGSNTQFKYVDLYFYQHGILNFKTTEGITVNTDTSDKILRLLGEPEIKTELTGTTPAEKWEYPSKGFGFIVIKSSKLVTVSYVYSSYFYALLSDGVTKVTYTKYPYEIGNGWALDNVLYTMTNVINKLGTDYIKASSTTTTLRNYKMSVDNQKVYFYFYSDSEDDFSGKKIQSILID